MTLNWNSKPTDKVLRLEPGASSFDIRPHVRETIEKARRDGQTHDTASTSIPALRKADFPKVTNENGLQVTGPDSTLVTQGASHGLHVVFRALLEPGNEGILPDLM